MIEILAENRQALEKELKEKVRAFFEVNDAAPGKVSIEMAFKELGQDNGSSTIHIHVKDNR